MVQSWSHGRVNALLIGALVVGISTGGELQAQSLRGSSASMDIQNRIADEHDFTYLETGAQVLRFVNAGYLIEVKPNRDFDLHAVSFPYARPEAELFIRRLANQYHAGCGEKLVVTSLTRPQDRQPRNASTRSVHPTGMAIDLRLSNSSRCRSWLEGVLTSLERARVLEATRERNPAHYHVALFPQQYANYVERILDAPAPLRRAAPVQTSVLEYEVRPGDSLWTIARAFDTSVEQIQAQNDLRGSRIYAGQVIQVPSSSN